MKTPMRFLLASVFLFGGLVKVADASELPAGFGNYCVTFPFFPLAPKTTLVFNYSWRTFDYRSRRLMDQGNFSTPGSASRIGNIGAGEVRMDRRTVCLNMPKLRTNLYENRGREGNIKMAPVQAIIKSGSRRAVCPKTTNDYENWSDDFKFFIHIKKVSSSERILQCKRKRPIPK